MLAPLRRAVRVLKGEKGRISHGRRELKGRVHISKGMSTEHGVRVRVEPWERALDAYLSA